MFRIAAFSLFKVTAVGLMVLSVGEAFRLPLDDIWFDMFVFYLLGRWFLTSVVEGMPEPEEDSSLWYIWVFRSMHSMAHIGTMYFSHRRVWKYLTGQIPNEMHPSRHRDTQSDGPREIEDLEE